MAKKIKLEMTEEQMKAIIAMRDEMIVGLDWLTRVVLSAAAF